MIGAGAAIGAGLKIAGGIFGGISASKAMKKNKANIEQQQRDNKAWYDMRYNEDATQRADAQRILAKTTEAILNRNKQAAATQAVMGGTDESLALAKAQNNQAAAEAAAQIAVAGDARKDNIEDMYRQTDAALEGKLNDLERQRAANVTQAVQGVAQAAGGLASAIG